MAALTELIDQICQDATLERRWLNTLSLLELVGARKINAVMGHSHDVGMLEHLHDEVGHARALKSLAGDETEYLSRVSGLRYFHELDHRITALLQAAEGEAPKSYREVSWAIELRAMQVYPSFRDCTDRQDVRATLISIIDEEKAHRSQLQREVSVLGEDKLAQIKAIEKECWIPFEKALWAALEA